ncbi:LacI family transcriptional regulator [Arthrobacter sp. SLBN-112]|jgi:DNA-binding LacI/PurR family transcriptional regulator|uniref:LacI family DNA-binding transcriptional regulator n=1 Tax=Arthrobacter sp. SLBN-112 TaxID=2768452 RepID=UPI001153F72A|nr:LacI family DNA-binding transcriptional regulator [Arthrobacter sp. SLBN-112]TQJ39314.1 LacI family transcriptional regulator [Arthrobacter sp. SLBN-112]
MNANSSRPAAPPVAGRTSPTLEDLASAAGVSRSTASRAINGGSKVSREAQAAVDAAIVALGYTPNRAARSLVTRRTGSVALVIPEPDARVMMDPYFAAVITGVNEALRDTDLQLVLLMSRAGDDSARTIRYLRGGHVDGAIVVSHHRADDWVETLGATGLPTVFIGRPWDTASGIPYVDLDNFEGGRLAARHLAGIGRTRLGSIAGPTDMTAAVDRLDGWLQGLREAGLQAGPVIHGDFTTAGGADAAKSLLDGTPGLDGVFAASDLMALGVVETLRAAGRRVPDDVAVVGFDNHDIQAANGLGLTTVAHPMVDMAATAGRLLARAIEEPGIALESVIYPAELVVRGSTAS